MIIAMHSGERYKVAKPSAFAPTPMLAYEGVTDMLTFKGIRLDDASRNCSLVSVCLSDIAYVG